MRRRGPKLLRRPNSQLKRRDPQRSEEWLNQEYQSRHVSDEFKVGSIPYVAFDARGHNPGFPGLRTRTSRRWYRHWQTKEFVLPVPYINVVGKFTIHLLGTWKTTPETWYASITSTIDSRLWSLFSARFRRRKCTDSDRNLITKISALYAYTHNNYFLDRVLATLRPGKLQHAKSIYYSFAKRLGENFRFVNSQTNLQVSWLNFRSVWIRDKPTVVARCFDTFSHLLGRKRKNKRVSFNEGNPYLKTINYLVVNRLEITRDGKWYPVD